MNYDDYYYDSRSAVDEIVDDSVMKITDIIKEKAKNEINDILQAAEQEKRLNNALHSELIEASQTICDLKKEVNRLTKELEAVKNSPVNSPFKVDDEVQIIVEAGQKNLCCEKCHGDGYVYIEHERETLQVVCPVCGNRDYRGQKKSKVTYHTYESETAKIEYITLAVDQKGMRWQYGVNGYYGWKNLDTVYSTDMDITPIIEQKNKEAYEKALAKLNGED